MIRKYLLCLAISLGLLLAPSVGVSQASGTIYYVSSSGGLDTNTGLSAAEPFRTIAKVNTLNLLPGDQVLFKCGDTWRAEQLVISKSGTAGAPITFGSYPAGCANRPSLSGSQPVAGWAVYSGTIYVATLSSAIFPNGINQLFRNGQRLTLGRWPNLNAGNGGYAFVSTHTAGSNQITVPGLAAGTNIWKDVTVHIKNIRWSMVDRQVTASSGTTLTLNQGLSCLVSSWGSCAGWGLFINNGLATLDEDGEWFYDASTSKVYLVSASGVPVNIEGSVIQETGVTLRQGGVNLSDGSATAYVVIDNLEIKNWFNHGIGTPGGMNGDIYHDLTVRNVTIKDVDGAGVNLSSWLERPSNGRKGLRGGDHLTFTNNVIDGANDFGITGYFAASTFENNTIRNIALIANLGKSGMGCGLTSSECTENGDGFRIRLYDVRDSGYGNTLRYNVFERTGYNAVDVFGPETTLEYNFITQACFSKADCGGVRVFGDTSLAATTVYNIYLRHNIIFDIPGNVDGCHSGLAAFGMGLYIDNYSRNVETRANTVISTTISGILYQHSSGQIVDNTVYNASTGTEYSAHIDLGGDDTRVTISGNRLFGLSPTAWTLYASSRSNYVSSDYNYLFHPYISQQIAFGSSWTRYTFSGWQAYSGLEAHSHPNWYTQSLGQAPRSRVFYNATQSAQIVDLGTRKYLDLDQNEVLGSIALAPFTSVILVDNGDAEIQLLSMTPSMWAVTEAANFQLSVQGVGFTSDSVVQWNGSPRPTAFVRSDLLLASIGQSDVQIAADIPVTVYDPSRSPNETASLTFRVVEQIWRTYLPALFR
jgi:hypothetical protein